MGVRGMPGFINGNIQFTGAQPCAIVKAVVEKVLDGEGAVAALESG